MVRDVPTVTGVRRVVVVSPRDRSHRARTVVVLPLSLSVPLEVKPFHYELIDVYAFLSATNPVWIKGDMVGHVSTGRLTPFHVDGSATRCKLSDADFAGVRRAVAAAVGIRLTG